MISLRVDAYIQRSLWQDGSAPKLVFEEPDVLRQWLTRYAGKELTVYLMDRKKDKTQAQLGYLFGHVIPQIAAYTGYSEEEVYGILKYKFLRVTAGCGVAKVDSIEDLEYVRGVSDLTREEVAKFIDDCIAWGTCLGCEIFPPKHYGGTQ